MVRSGWGRKIYQDDRANITAKNRGGARVIDGEVFIQFESKEINIADIEVYNISVENNHNYIVEGVHVHNCYVAKSPEDNLKDIFRADYDIAQTFAFCFHLDECLSLSSPFNSAY